MKIHYLLYSILCLMAACQPAGPTPFAATVPAVQSGSIVVQESTRWPTVNPTITSRQTDTPTLTQTPPPTLTASEPPTPTLAATETATANLLAAPSTVPTLERKEHFVFQRPVSRDKVDWLDRTYPYGWTQYGARETHHGVEFVNPRFTPVLAAAGGTVVHAGSDRETRFGPSTNFYGNLVVLEHNLRSAEGQPVFTLYAHLERVEVEVGQVVQAGERIGVIGDSGVAIGPHLHFEVRVGDPQDYGATRNPDLWIYPYPKFGVLAGRVTNTAGVLQPGVILQVKSADNLRYAFTYADDTVNPDAAWGENFTLGDLPEGDYEVIISNRDGRVFFREAVSVTSGKITWLEISI